MLNFCQKSPPQTSFFAERHNPLTISLLPHQHCQKPLQATSKPSRRQGEGRAKGERRISVSSLNIKRIKTVPSLCIIRNKIHKTLHFLPFLPLPYPPLSTPIHPYPPLSTPIHPYPPLSTPIHTYPHLSTPIHTYPHLSTPIHTSLPPATHRHFRFVRQSCPVLPTSD